MSQSLPLTYSHLFASFFHQDLLSPDASLVSLALATLPSLLNAQLAQDLTHDISSLLTHSKPTVRKRAVLSLYRVFEKYPEALIDNVERLRERLGDDDQGPFAACRAAQRPVRPMNLTFYLFCLYSLTRRCLCDCQRPDGTCGQERGQLLASRSSAVRDPLHKSEQLDVDQGRQTGAPTLSKASWLLY